MTEIENLQKEILAIQPSVTADEVLAVYDNLLFLRKEIARLIGLCEIQMIEYINVNGDIEVREGVRYYVSTPKTTKCINIPEAVRAILNGVNGDFDEFCKLLVSQPIKHGAASKVLEPVVYESLFHEERKESLETGKPIKKLLKSDDAFVK